MSGLHVRSDLTLSLPFKCPVIIHILFHQTADGWFSQTEKEYVNIFNCRLIDML